jgi:GTP-binding protein
VPLYVASALHQVPRSTLPEVAFVGRSNVGKSTLLNALLCHPICRTSSKPGRTRALHAYALGGRNERTGDAGLITLLDVPGYGHGGHDKWELALRRYLAKRKELRRVYVLVDAMHGVKRSDADMLAFLRESGVPHQVVLAKVDRLLFPQGKGGGEEGKSNVERVVEDVRRVSQPTGKARQGQGVPALGEVLCVSAEMGRFKPWSSEPGGTLGLGALRWSVLRATGFERFERKGMAKKMEPEVVIDKAR